MIRAGGKREDAATEGGRRREGGRRGRARGREPGGEHWREGDWERPRKREGVTGRRGRVRVGLRVIYLRDLLGLYMGRLHCFAGRVGGDRGRGPGNHPCPRHP